VRVRVCVCVCVCVRVCVRVCARVRGYDCASVTSGYCTLGDVSSRANMQQEKHLRHPCQTRAGEFYVKEFVARTMVS
jgi:hypothetical protein